MNSFPEGFGRLAATFGLLAASCVGAGFCYRFGVVPHGLRWLPILVPLPLLALLFHQAGIYLRRLDEMQVRVHMEALALMSFWLLAIFAVTSLLHQSGLGGPEDWNLPWAMIWLGWLAAFARAARKFE